VGIGAQKLDTIESHPARLREDAQQPDMIAAIPFATAHCAQQPDASDAIPPRYCALRAETRHHRIHHPDLPRTARRNQAPSRAILHAIRRTDTSLTQC
jgi:hypothetical protein